MKKWLCKWLPVVLLLALGSEPAWGQGRIATVDLRKIFEGYWKKKQAEAQLKDRNADMEKEDKNMLDDYKKMKEDLQTLQTSINEAAISPDERDKRKKAAEDKLKQMKDQEDLITQYERQARTTIGEQSQRMRAKILDEIRNVVNAKAKAAGYALVVDTAAETVNATPIFLYTNNENDLTDAVLAQLNETDPARLARPEAAPAEKKDEKKKDSKK